MRKVADVRHHAREPLAGVSGQELILRFCCSAALGTRQRVPFDDIFGQRIEERHVALARLRIADGTVVKPRLVHNRDDVDGCHAIRIIFSKIFCFRLFLARIGNRCHFVFRIAVRRCQAHVFGDRGKTDCRSVLAVCLRRIPEVTDDTEFGVPIQIHVRQVCSERQRSSSHAEQNFIPRFPCKTVFPALQPEAHNEHHRDKRSHDFTCDLEFVAADYVRRRRNAVQVDELERFSAEQINIVEYQTHAEIKDVHENHRAADGVQKEGNENGKYENDTDIQQRIIPFHLPELAVCDKFQCGKQIGCVCQHQNRLFPSHIARFWFLVRLCSKPAETDDCRQYDTRQQAREQKVNTPLPVCRRRIQQRARQKQQHRQHAEIQNKKRAPGALLLILF